MPLNGHQKIKTWSLYELSDSLWSNTHNTTGSCKEYRGKWHVLHPCAGWGIRIHDYRLITVTQLYVQLNPFATKRCHIYFVTLDHPGIRQNLNLRNASCMHGLYISFTLYGGTFPVQVEPTLIFSFGHPFRWRFVVCHHQSLSLQLQYSKLKLEKVGCWLTQSEK